MNKTIDRALVIEGLKYTLSLLESQEPRILAYDELEGTMGSCAVWYEAFLTETPCLAMVLSKSSTECAYWIYDFLSETKHKCTEQTYGASWRCWSEKPTREQREAYAWPWAK